MIIVMIITVDLAQVAQRLTGVEIITIDIIITITVILLLLYY